MMLQKPSLKVDDYNEEIASAGILSDDGWEDMYELDVSLRPLRASERYVAKRTQHETTHEIGCRFVTDISPEKRFKYYDENREQYRYFYIAGIKDPDELGAELQLTVSEIWPQGTR